MQVIFLLTTHIPLEHNIYTPATGFHFLSFTFTHLCPSEVPVHTHSHTLLNSTRHSYGEEETDMQD